MSEQSSPKAAAIHAELSKLRAVVDAEALAVSRLEREVATLQAMLPLGHASVDDFDLER